MTRHVLAMGDVGAGDLLHVGDEAMLETAMAEIGARQDVTWMLVSSHPAETADRYGVSAVGRFGFGLLTHQAEREARLEAITAAARLEKHLVVGDPAQALLDAVAAADVVLIAGGGNLASTWPEHVYERAALALVAAARKTPLVVSGQSLGPQLTERDGELVGRVLTEAQLVGLRERSSAAVARRLGVPESKTWCTVDDAWTLPEEEPAQAPTEPFVAVTFSDLLGLEGAADLAEGLSQLLDDVVELTGLEVLLVPHHGAVHGQARADVAFHDLLAQGTKSGRVRSAPLLPARQVAWLTRRAALVLTSRYHPVVFGLAAATPVVAVAVDDYTENKLRGALDLMGLEGWCVSVLGLRAGFLRTAIEEAWRRRIDITTQLAAATARHSVTKATYWDAVAAVVAGGPIPSRAVDLGDLDVPRSGVPEGDWTVRNHDALAWSRLFASHRGDLARAAELAEQARFAAVDELEVQHRVRRDAVDELIALKGALAVERAAGEAARWNNAEVLERNLSMLKDRDERLEQQVEELEAAQQSAAEYARLQQTKLLRWSGPARQAYSSFRKR